MDVIRGQNCDSRIEWLQDANGVDIPTRVFELAGPRAPVLMVHGLQSHSGWFGQSAMYLAERGSTVYALDRRGSGLSRQSRGDCRDFRDWIAELRTVADHAMRRHETGQIHVFGHCFGAVPATAFACAHPASVRSLVLASPGLFTTTTVNAVDRLRILRSRLTGAPVRIRVPLEPTMFSELQEWIRFIKQDELAVRDVTGSFLYEVRRARRFVARNISALTMPVAMMCAAQDAICDNEANHRFLERMPSGLKSWRQYDPARHVLEFSPRRDEFLRDLDSWFGRFEPEVA